MQVLKFASRSQNCSAKSSLKPDGSPRTGPYSSVTTAGNVEISTPRCRSNTLRIERRSEMKRARMTTPLRRVLNTCVRNFTEEFGGRVGHGERSDRVRTR